MSHNLYFENNNLNTASSILPSPFSVDIYEKYFKAKSVISSTTR